MTPDAHDTARSIALRFATVYFVSYSLANLPHPLTMVPGLSLWTDGWNLLVPFVGTRVLGMEAPIVLFGAGSGDTSGDYVRVFLFFIVALIAAPIWHHLDRGRARPLLASALTVWARYWLAAFMILYGVYKVCKLQFPDLDVVRLTQPFGESSPGELVWAFMGHSTLYNVFTGGAEVLGGLLLLSRRTTTLGALICIGVMANVVMLNFSYDIAVKLFSSHMLVVALVLAGHDARRLADLFLFERAVEARPIPALAASRPRARRIIKTIWLLALFAGVGLEIVLARPMVAANPLAGIYEVVDDRVACNPANNCRADESTSWRRVIIGNWQLVLETTEAERLAFRLVVDGSALSLAGDGTTAELEVLRLDDDEIVLEGEVDGVHHRTHLRRVEVAFLLETRAFRWITEAPF